MSPDFFVTYLPDRSVTRDREQLNRFLKGIAIIFDSFKHFFLCFDIPVLERMNSISSKLSPFYKGLVILVDMLYAFRKKLLQLF